MAIRSGRFKVSTVPADGITIVVGRTGAYYRIFNSTAPTPALIASGDADFNVFVGAVSTLLKPGFSLDVVVDANIVIKAPAGKPIEGIYDFLNSTNTEGAGRSGRFNIKSGAAAKHKIIDLRIGGQKKKAYYRIFNSGDYAIILSEGSGAGASTLGTVEPAQSFDFEVGDGPKRDIYVNSSADDKPISGIYEFLGNE